MKERFILNALNDMKGTDVEAHILEIGSDGMFVRLVDSHMEGLCQWIVCKCNANSNGLELKAKRRIHLRSA